MDRNERENIIPPKAQEPVVFLVNSAPMCRSAS